VGATATETAREVEALRAETERLLDALDNETQRLVSLPQRLLRNPVVAAGLGLAALLAVLVFAYRAYRRAREARQPTARLRRGAEQFGATARARASSVGRALRGESIEEQQARAEQESLWQKLAGTLVATATLALVDQFTRWLSKRNSVTPS
jgi:hypothetical protein